MDKAKLQQQIQDDFVFLHQCPETAYQERQTSEYIAKVMNTLGFSVKKGVGSETGMIASFDSGVKGKCIAVRADMDALPFDVGGNRVAIHACGHDANCAMVMGAARLLMEKKIKRGKIKFVFQPAEEGDGGSRTIIHSGELEDVDELIGIHLVAKDELPKGYGCCGVHHCAASQFKAVIKGVACHGSKPHLGINAIDAGILAINAVKQIYVNPEIIHSIKVTKFVSGENSINTIPDEVFLGIDVRCYDNTEMEKIIDEICFRIQQAVSAAGATVEILDKGFGPGANYDSGMMDTAEKVMEDILGPGKVRREMYNSAGEDFHYYGRLLGVKNIYIGLGADLEPWLHHQNMHFEKQVLPVGAQIIYKIVKERVGF